MGSTDALTDRQRIVRSVKPQVSSGRPADPVSWWRVLEEFGKVRRPGKGLSRASDLLLDADPWSSRSVAPGAPLALGRGGVPAPRLPVFPTASYPALGRQARCVR